jgi:dTDP-4-dehydrorhamnose reductase
LPNNAIIIRTSWLYSEYGNNFLGTILRLGNEKGELSIVDDQIGSPTYAGDLASTIIYIAINEEFIDTNFITQIYHYSNIGQCSWYEFTKEIFKLSATKCTVRPINTKQYPTAAKRPIYTVLNKDKITATFDIKIPKWKDSLGKCIKSLQ